MGVENSGLRLDSLVDVNHTISVRRPEFFLFFLSLLCFFRPSLIRRSSRAPCLEIEIHRVYTQRWPSKGFTSYRRSWKQTPEHGVPNLCLKARAQKTHAYLFRTRTTMNPRRATPTGHTPCLHVHFHQVHIIRSQLLNAVITGLLSCHL